MPYSVSLTTGSTLNPDPQLGNFWATYEEKKGGGIESHPIFLNLTKRVRRARRRGQFVRSVHVVG
jgi:hypothetical protein